MIFPFFSHRTTIIHHGHRGTMASRISPAAASGPVGPVGPVALRRQGMGSTKPVLAGPKRWKTCRKFGNPNELWKQNPSHSIEFWLV